MRNVNGYLHNILLLKRADYVNSAYRLLKLGPLTYRHKYGGWRSFRFFELERILMNSWLILMWSYFSVQWSPISERTLLCLIDPRLRSPVLTTVVLRRRKLWNDSDRALREKTVPVPLCPSNLTWTELGSKLVLLYERTATNRMSHSTALQKTTL